MPLKKVLVTGACGAIGRYAAAAFASRGWRVSGIGHGAWTEKEQTACGLSDWLTADITRDAMRHCMDRCGGPFDAIAHCAGSGSVAASFNSPLRDFQRNVATTAEVLDFARADTPCAALVFVSSAAVYGDVALRPTPVDAPLNPVSPYGVHKKMAEDMVATYARLFGFKTIIVRYFSIYGEGFRKQLLWDACSRIVKGDACFWGTGEETRDWLHASDAASLLVEAAARADTTYPIINGGYGASVRVRDIVDELAHLLKSPVTPSFNGQTSPGDPRHYMADMSVPLDWGWRPQIPWQEGLSRYVAWFREQCP